MEKLIPCFFYNHIQSRIYSKYHLHILEPGGRVVRKTYQGRATSSLFLRNAIHHHKSELNHLSWTWKIDRDFSKLMFPFFQKKSSIELRTRVPWCRETKKLVHYSTTPHNSTFVCGCLSFLKVKFFAKLDSCFCLMPP